MAGSGAKSDAQKALAALRLAAGGTLEQAAEASGAAKRTVRRWHAEDAAFRAEVDQLRGQIISRACGILADGMAEASAELRRLVANEDARIRLRAADVLLARGLDLKAAADDGRRLDELERRILGDGQGRDTPGSGGGVGGGG